MEVGELEFGSYLIVVDIAALAEEMTNVYAPGETWTATLEGIDLGDLTLRTTD